MVLYLIGTVPPSPPPLLFSIPSSHLIVLFVLRTAGRREISPSTLLAKSSLSSRLRGLGLEGVGCTLDIAYLDTVCQGTSLFVSQSLYLVYVINLSKLTQYFGWFTLTMTHCGTHTKWGQFLFRGMAMVIAPSDQSADCDCGVVGI